MYGATCSIVRPCGLSQATVVAPGECWFIATLCEVIDTASGTVRH